MSLPLLNKSHPTKPADLRISTPFVHHYLTTTPQVLGFKRQPVQLLLILLEILQDLLDTSRFHSRRPCLIIIIICALLVVLGTPLGPPVTPPEEHPPEKHPASNPRTSHRGAVIDPLKELNALMAPATAHPATTIRSRHRCIIITIQPPTEPTL